MPIGMIIMRWDERVGAEICINYPPDVQISEKTLMQVYSTHEYSGEAGLVSLTVGPLNVASYYTGPETSYYILLILSLEEDPDAFEDGMADAAHVILSNLEKDAYKNLISSIFQRISVYPSLNEEQKLAMIYTDEIKRMILQRLRDEGNVSKSELAVWLKDTHRSGFVDIEGAISALMKEELVKESSVKGVSSEIIFLLNDLIITRIPPTKLIREAKQHGLPASIYEDYKHEVLTFFENYVPDEKGMLNVLEYLLDPPVYETLTLLRMAAVTRDDLEKLKKKGVDNIDSVLKTLWDANLVVVLRDDKGNEYYALKTDILIKKYFPQHILDIIRKGYRERTKTSTTLLEHLSILEDYYYILKGKKSKTETETNIDEKSAIAAN